MARMPQHAQGKALPKRRHFHGFTLAEILIALALIAILAAVLLPTVAGQILKGDAGRVMQDLNAVRAGADQFLADVHRYPGKYSDLSTKIVGNSALHLDINGSQYSPGLADKWSGPYVTKDLLNGVVETGFGGTIINTFIKTLNTNNVDYLTVQVVGITGADFDRIDAQIDGPSVSPAGRTSGQLRWITGGVTDPDTTKFLATPIQ